MCAGSKCQCPPGTTVTTKHLGESLVFYQAEKGRSKAIARVDVIAGDVAHSFNGDIVTRYTAEDLRAWASAFTDLANSLDALKPNTQTPTPPEQATTK